MNTKNKITLILAGLMLIMFIGMLINSTLNSRHYGLVSVENKAQAVAQSVKHGLTAHMLNGMMDNRLFFLEQIKTLSDVNDIWLVRGDSVIKQYGKGMFGEGLKDTIDKYVIENGVTEKKIDEHLFSKSSFRITIPYIAESTHRIDCTSCHDAKVGDTLGAISMVIDIDDLKEAGINNILTNSLMGFIVIIIIVFFVNFTIKPYVQIFDSIKETMKFANSGDYSHRVNGGSFGEANEVARWINSLLEKLNKTLNDIDGKVKLFLNQKKDEIGSDPLLNVRDTVDRLADIYKFRRTIELDSHIDEVYSRLSVVLTDKFGLTHFNFLEADTTNKSMRSSFKNGGLMCEAVQRGCRADLTSTLVDSCQFKDLCNRRYEQGGNYFCIPYSISNDLDFIINIETKTEDEHERVREILPFIKDYIETAKPEIVSKKLMTMLEKSARTDALTGLFNRKYLEESIASIVSQSKRANISYGILMCDIDYFKMINDTYGHDVGDEAIRVIANTLKENTRESDTVIRYGGEEFIVLLYNCDATYVEQVAQKIRVEFSKKKISSGHETFSKTVSIGASMFPENDSNFWKCIKFADIALYEAKESGRNKVVLFEEKLLENKNLETEY